VSRLHDVDCATKEFRWYDRRKLRLSRATSARKPIIAGRDSFRASRGWTRAQRALIRLRPVRAASLSLSLSLFIYIYIYISLFPGRKVIIFIRSGKCLTKRGARYCCADSSRSDCCFVSLTRRVCRLAGPRKSRSACARAFNHKRLLMQRDADTGNVKTDCIISATRIKRAPLYRFKSPFAARFERARSSADRCGCYFASRVRILLSQLFCDTRGRELFRHVDGARIIRFHPQYPVFLRRSSKLFSTSDVQIKCFIIFRCRRDQMEHSASPRNIPRNIPEYN